MLASKYTECGSEISELSSYSEKKVKLVCDSCGKETITTFGNYTQYQKKTKRSGKTFCQRCAVKQTSDKNVGRPAPAVAVANSRRRQQRNPNWSGGRYVAKDGYVMVRSTSPKGNLRYRREHVVRMEQKIGRRLVKGEVVHHIDGVRSNNRLSNLWLTTSKKHREAHISLNDIAAQLVSAGLVKFDRRTGSYHVANLKLRELLEHPEEDDQQPSLGGDT